MTVEEFVRAWLPDPPARILEVGAGSGELAEALRSSGYDVDAIDTRRDLRTGVRSLDLRALDASDGLFDAMIAVRVFHHLDDVRDGVATVARRLHDDGLLLVQDFGWDLVDLAIATWMHNEARRIGVADVPADPVSYYERWREEHHRLTTVREINAALEANLDEVHREWIPYLADEYLRGDPLARRREIDGLAQGRLRPVAFRYVGRRA